MPNDRESPVEPDDEFSAAARELGDRFLPDQPDPANPATAAGRAAATRTDGIFDEETQRELYDRMWLDLFKHTPDAQEWQLVAELEARVRRREAEQWDRDWDRLFAEIVTLVRVDQTNPVAWWNAIAAETDIDLGMVVTDTPYIPPPPQEPGLSWEAMANHADVEFRVLVPDDGGNPETDWNGRYHIDPTGPIDGGGWQSLGSMEYLAGDPAPPASGVSGSINWDFGAKRDRDDANLGAGDPTGLVGEIRPLTDRLRQALTDDLSTGADASSNPSDNAASPPGDSGDEAWDAVVAQAEARIQDSNLDHETGLDEESGIDPGDPQPTPPEESVLDFIDQEPPETITVIVDSNAEPAEIDLDRNPITDLAFPDGLPEDFRRFPDPPSPVPPDRSMLDSLEDDEPLRRGPTSPFQAIDRELEAERRAQKQVKRRGGVPIWAWPAVAVAIIAIGGFFAFGSGGDDEPDAAVTGGDNATPVATAVAPVAATAPATTATPSSTATAVPSPAATVTAVQIPTLRICPDGSSFSGYEQPNGSFLDAETNEPRVCPPPPN